MPEKIDWSKWPFPQSGSTPRPEDGENRNSYPSSVNILPSTEQNGAESIERVLLVGQALKAWNEAQLAELKRSCAAFFDKRTAALKALFGGELPIDRPFTSLQPEVQAALREKFRSDPSSHEFATPQALEAWMRTTRVTHVLSYLHAFIAVYAPSGPEPQVFAPFAVRHFAVGRVRPVTIRLGSRGK